MRFISNVQPNSSHSVAVARSGVHGIAWVVAFIVLLSIAAQVKLSVPFTPVPITMQTLVVVLAGVALGPWLGLSAVAAYLAAGFVGLPVFSGAAGLSTLSGATGGYLLAFLLATPMVGMMTRGGVTWPRVAAAALLAHGLIIAIGAAWLGVWSHSTVGSAVAMGVVPFIPGTMLKVAIAALIAPKLIGRR